MPESRPIPTIEYQDFSLNVHDRAAHDQRVIKAQLELTYRCNLHCRHCYTDPYNDKAFFPRELTTTEIFRLLDEMQELGIIWLNLTGGDIFMHPDFFEIYEAAYRKGFLLQLYTNGTLFTKAVVDRLVAHPPFTIDLSMHAADETQFDWFTQVPGSYRAFLRGLALLKESGLSVTLKATAMNWNQGELPALRRFAESWGFPLHVSRMLSPRLNGDCSSLEYRMSPDAVAALTLPDQELESSSACSTMAEWQAPATDHLFRCGCGTDTIHISAWGELGTCTMQYLDRASLREWSLKQAIDRVFEAVRARRYQTDSACRSCEIHQFCDKKPAEALKECGSAEAPIPFHCDVALARATRITKQPLLHPLQQRTQSPAAMQY